MPRAGFEPTTPGSHERCSNIPLGAFDFSGICCVYLDRHIRVDLSDDEQFVRNMPCYIQSQRNCEEIKTDN